MSANSRLMLDYTGVTGDPCKITGVYRTRCDHFVEIDLREGETLPSCPVCKNSIRRDWVRRD